MVDGSGALSRTRPDGARPVRDDHDAAAAFVLAASRHARADARVVLALGARAGRVGAQDKVHPVPAADLRDVGDGGAALGRPPSTSTSRGTGNGTSGGARDRRLRVAG